MKNINGMMKAAIKWETGYLTYGEIYSQLFLLDPEYMEKHHMTVRIDLIIHAIKLAWILQEMAAEKVAQTAEDLKLVVGNDEETPGKLDGLQASAEQA